MAKDLLIIMAKAPILGRVKTRLAQAIGVQKALDVYIELLKHTINTANKIEEKKVIFWDTISVDLPKITIKNRLQANGTIGDKMHHAFMSYFEKKYDRVVLIGSDCYDLEAKHLRTAFDMLKEFDAVIGPAKDGGYYLIGFQQKSYHQDVFKQIDWSTASVFSKTLQRFDEKKYHYFTLEECNDLDLHEDYLAYCQSKKKHP